MKALAQGYGTGFECVFVCERVCLFMCIRVCACVCVIACLRSSGLLVEGAYVAALTELSVFDVCMNYV
jgi:hypothetical protein